MRIYIHTIAELVELLESEIQKKREQIGKTRTKVQSSEFRGEVFALNEAIFYIKQYAKTVEEDKNARSAEEMGYNGDDLPDDTAPSPVPANSRKSA